jgi:hypothetical protein
LRIFTAVRHSNDPSRYYGGLWSANFYPALRELDHELIESQTDLLPTSRFIGVAGDFTREELEIRAQTTERILDEVRAALRVGPVDLFLSYFYNAHFDPAGFDELCRLGILTVNFYCNSIYQFELVAAIAAKVDFAWHAERDARASYLAVGATPVWVQMGADPNLCHPVAGVVRSAKACFVGQRYADRDRWMAALIRAGVPVAIYGAGWGLKTDQFGAIATVGSSDTYLGRVHPKPGSLASYATACRRIAQREGVIGGLARGWRQWQRRRETRALDALVSPHAKGRALEINGVFASCELCLNFSNVWANGLPGSALIPHVRLRDFEAPMSRTCYLTGHTDEITEFYEVGKEIDTYLSPEELVEKARYYLSHPEIAERLRDAGYHRALRDHTWRRRFEQLFGLIFSRN